MLKFIPGSMRATVEKFFTGGMRIASAMIRPHVVSFLDEMPRSEHKLRVEEVVVPKTFEPRALGTLELRSANYVLRPYAPAATGCSIRLPTSCSNPDLPSPPWRPRRDAARSSCR